MLPSEEIKDKINIVDLIGEYVPLRKAGVNFRAVCPFHQEKTPSFMVSATKQIWHCFGCGLGGDIFEFVKQSEGVEFPEALRILASRAGVVLQKPTVEYQKETDQKKVLYEINELAARYYQAVLVKSQGAQAAREYLQKRGLKPETIEKWRLGYAVDDFHAFENFIVKRGYQKQEAVAAGLLAKKEETLRSVQGDNYYDRFRGRIMFPFFDIHGRVVGFTARILDSGRPEPAEGRVVSKYVNSPETLIYSKSQLIYGLHLAKTEIRKQGEVVVVEGNVDVITCHEFGYTNIVGSSGTAFTDQQIETLKRFTDSISFAFDVDEAGLAATRRAVELALSIGFTVKIVALPKEIAKDPDELVRKNPTLWEDRVKGAKNYLDFYFDAIFAIINLESSSDKKQAVSTILPLLSLLPSPIDRSHYLQKLADKLGVDQKILLDLLNKLRSGKARTTGSAGQERKAPVRPYPKQTMLERRVLGLLLKFSESLAKDWSELSSEDFADGTLREIFTAAAGEVGTGRLTVDQFKDTFPKYAAEVGLLIFGIENELSLGADWKIEDLKKQFLGDLKSTGLKKQMQELTARIRQAEGAGKIDEVRVLSSQFNNLTREINKYQ